MAVSNVLEFKKGRTGTDKEKGVREYTRQFWVTTSNHRDGPQIVKADVRIPKIKDGYASGNDSDPASRCIERNASLFNDNGRDWLVECKYSTESDGDSDNPLLRPKRYRFGGAKFQKPIEKDLDGKPVRNSAGQYFDPPCEIDDSRPVLNVEWYEANCDGQRVSDYQDAINSDAFLITAVNLSVNPKQAKVGNLEAEDEIYQGQRIWKYSLELHLRREGWDKELVDQGKMQRVLIDTVDTDEDGEDDQEIEGLRPCFDEDGKEVSEPVLLDGEGRQAAVNAAPVYLKFKAYKPLPFAAFGLRSTERTLNMPATVFNLDDSAIAANAAIKSTKLQHVTKIPASATGTIAAGTYYLAGMTAAARVLAFEAAITEAIATGADRTVTVDLQRSTGAGAFASILSAALVFNNGSSLRALVAATVTTADLSDGDLLRVVVTVAGSAGAQAQGLLTTLTLRDDPQ